MPVTDKDLNSAFDELAVQFEHLRKLRKSQSWPADAAVREALYPRLHNVRAVLHTAQLTANARDASQLPGGEAPLWKPS